MNWIGTHIEITPPTRPKKITATRFATVLGKNPWATPFEIWCAVTRTYEKPFEDTIYTIAGKTIEPKQIAYMRKAYAMDNLRSPMDIYGADYFKRTHGDFFPDTPIFGGMWDSLLVDADGKPKTVLEFKTTKRSEDWARDVPEYYALQASLYAYLLGVDDVIMVASFLNGKDYDHPEAFVPSASNTITVEFKVSERYPDMEMLIHKATCWWREYVETGISPDYDEKRDAEILNALSIRRLSLDVMNKQIAAAEKLRSEVEAAKEAITKKVKELAEAEETIKQNAIAELRDTDKAVEVKGKTYTWTVSRTKCVTVDKDALEADGLLDKYAKPATQYRMTVKKKENTDEPNV